MGVAIRSIGTYLPERVVCNTDLEEKIQDVGIRLPDGSLKKMFGIESRRYAAPCQQVSDMACLASEYLWNTVDKSCIDLLIFASASGDMIEPATASIIQNKLGLTCPSFDVKNACNSYVTALHLAHALLKGEFYDNIFILTSEKLSDTVRLQPTSMEDFKSNLASFSFGDAATATLLCKSDNPN